MTRKRYAKHGTQNAIRSLYAVVLVGGKGKRLRPLSTEKCPKAFLSVTRNRKSMFANTIRRLKRLIPLSRIVVVANRMHARLVRRDFPEIKNGNLMLEPVSRNTAPAVGLAAMELRRRDPDAVMAVFPTDHYIRDEERHLAAVKSAVDFLKGRRDAMVVFGIRPTYPSTGFGYIKLSDLQDKGPDRVKKIARFVEKPDLRTAKRYLASGQYLWNSGAFIFAADTFLKALERLSPVIYRGLSGIKNTNKVYARLPDISLDYAVMEKAENIYCITGSYGWNDVGSFDALKKVLKSQSRKFVEECGKITRIL